ncbi:MAG: PEP-CTERM sorting domain-containing protein [Burkholderiaceae bacterium]|nr:PEP-CTERM sorting domain-containing protein [Burkholderiaceae bacterium]
MTPSRMLLAALAGAALTLPAQANLAYDFGSGLQGFAASGGVLSHNAGGWLELLDNDGNTDMVLQLPQLGDWSAYLGGTLSFDARNLSGMAPDWPEFGQLTLVAGGTTLGPIDSLAPNQPPADGQWHHYEIALSTAVFGAQLPQVLAGLTAVTLKLEYHATWGDDYEAIAFDNLAVSAVPEPAAWALLLGGGLLLPALRRRR